MASRRSRIKGIANIPPRRKTETKVVEETSTIELPDEAPGEKCNSAENNNCTLHIETKLEAVEVHPAQNDTNVLATDQVVSIIEPTLDQTKKPIASRRTFIKPLVSLKSLSNKAKQKPEEVPKINVPQAPLSTVQLTNKEVEISASARTISNSDSENIPEPQSPIKVINRSRIKAIPRLTQRRISSTVHGSASESEDDTNKKSYKRIRTESACSTASTSNDNFARVELELPQKPRDFNTVIQRKCRRTEQSNKMAEARRNFINKFRNKDRDKHKLTMLDLIFYNPTTKPMSQKPEKSDVRKSIEDSPQECEEEDVESDEENHVPAPQIKIGANGEIVVDEQSLIIENKQTKKDRENLQKSEVVDGDFDTGYGVYKRAKRSKDWSKEDTLFFYKVLNTLGTDFSLMVQLFPGRSRRELKMKFKKEEKINHSLIDKALTRPLQFNIKDLKEEVKMREKMKELERAEKEERLKQLQTQKKDTILPYMRKGANKNYKTKTKKRATKRKDIYSKIEKGIASVWDSDDEGESIEDADKEDEDESDDSTAPSTDVSSILKPTRYGRIPKQKVLTIEDPKVFKIREEHVQEEHQLEPGSLMVVYSQTPTGLPTFKVFMVTGNQTKVPVVIPSDVLTTLMKSFGDPSTTEVIPENNYTICHDDASNRAIEVQIQDVQENNLKTTS